MDIFVGIMAMLLVLCVFLPLLLWWLDLLFGEETPKEEEEEEVGTHRRRALQYLYGEARKIEGEEDD